MPNLTDVLLSELEDKPTVENLAMGVCIALYGTNTLMTNTLIQFDMSETATGGLQWLAPLGTWEQKAIHGDGMEFTFDGYSRLELHEDGKSVINSANGLYWDGGRLLPSDPVATATELVNTMVMTQVAFNAITPVANTQYLIVG